MAVSITPTETLTELWDAEATTGWTGSLSTFSGFQREGTNCLGMVVSNELEYAYRSCTSFNIQNNRMYVWMQPKGEMDTLANGGIRIVIGDGTNRIGYYVGGGNFYTPFTLNGWFCFMLDGNNLPANFDEVAGTEASLNLAAITVVGVGYKTLSKALGNVENCFFDIARQGTGLNIKGGTSGAPGLWSEIAADDALTTDGKAYGIVMEYQPGVYGVQGDINFGDNTGTTTTYFKDSNVTVVFLDTGALDLNMSVVGNSTGTNTFIDGVAVGSGDTINGRSGSTYLNAGPEVYIDFTDANLDVLQLYGTKFQLIDQGIDFGADTSHVLAGVTFQQSGQIDLSTVIARNIVFAETTNIDSALLWNESINIENSSFIANTTGAAIEMPSDAGDPYSYTNLLFSGNTYDVLNSSGNPITIQKDGTSDPSTYEGSVVTFAASVPLYIIVRDEANVPIQNAQVGVFKITPTEDLIDEYPSSNFSSSELMSGNDAYDACAQTFVPGVQGVLSKASFFISRTGTLTGNVYARLYATSGGAPTGTHLAESAGIAASTLSTSITVVDFTFTDEITMEEGVTYAIAVEYPTDDGAGNRINVGNDNTSPAHSGTAYRLSVALDTWSSSGTYDFIFYVYADVKEIVNQDTDVDGEVDTTYNQTTPVNVKVWIRKASSGATKYKNFSTLQTIATTTGLTLAVTMIVDPNNNALT